MARRSAISTSVGSCNRSTAAQEATSTTSPPSASSVASRPAPALVRAGELGPGGWPFVRQPVVEARLVGSASPRHRPGTIAARSRSCSTWSSGRPPAHRELDRLGLRQAPALERVDDGGQLVQALGELDVSAHLALALARRGGDVGGNVAIAVGPVELTIADGLEQAQPGRRRARRAAASRTSSPRRAWSSSSARLDAWSFVRSIPEESV